MASSKQSGDVLILYDTLPTAAVGYYVLLSVDVLCRLCHLGIDAAGNLIPTLSLIAVTLTDLDCFEPTGLTLELPGAFQL